MGKVLLRDLCKENEIGKYGIPASAEDFDSSKIRYLRISDIDDYGNLVDLDKRSVSSIDIDKYILEEGDLVVARTGNSTGRTYYHETKNGKLAFAGFLIKYGLDNKKVNPKYLKYFTISKEYRQWVENLSVGSTRGNINAQTFANCPINLPSKQQQDTLVNTLSALDNKIKLNNKINAELEAMAKTIYDYWFVQFDFPDKSGKPYKSSSGKMLYNKTLNREIPIGWEVDILDNYLEKIIDYRGKTPKKLNKNWSDNPNDIVALSAKHVKNGRLVDLHEANRVDKELYNAWMKDELKEGDILMTSEAPLGEFFYLIGRHKYCLSQRLFSIRANEKKIKSSYLYYELSNGNGYSQIIGKQSGSTVFGIRQDELRKVLILKPTLEVQTLFDKIVKKIYAQIRNNDYQNAEFSSLRDWLLPMLMNGQVKIKETEEMLSMAAEPESAY